MDEPFDKPITSTKGESREEALAALMQTFRTIWSEYWGVEKLLALEEQRFRRVREVLRPRSSLYALTNVEDLALKVLGACLVFNMMKEEKLSWNIIIQHVVIFIRQFLVKSDCFSPEELASIDIPERMAEEDRVLIIFTTIYLVCRERGEDAETLFGAVVHGKVPVTFWRNPGHPQAG